MGKKKTICIITFPQGGPFVWAKNLSEKLRKRGYKVTLASGRKEYVKQQFRCYDVIHTCVPLPNLFCKKYVLTIHGNYKEEKHLSRFLFPVAIWRANIITTPSRFLKEIINAKTAKIIPNGINIPEKTKNSYALKQGNPKIGILTNFNFISKSEGMINLAKIIQGISPQIELIIGGDGKFFEEYKRKILKIHENTKFIGYCKKEDLFGQIDIFAYYSFLDNQPLAVLEAMAFGLPVVSNEVGAVGEILGGGLKKYIAENEKDYEKILKELISSEKEREENGQEAKKISQEKSWEKIVERFIEIYEK